MENKRLLEERLAFYQLDPQDRAFKGVASAIRDRMSSALDDFYGEISARSELAGKFADRQAMDRARQAQARHWTSAFDKGLTEEFFRRSKHIGGVHARIGLEPKWYLGSYALILEELVCQLVAPGWRRHLPWNRAKVRQLVALLKVSLLDIDVALSAYFTGINGKVNSLNDVLGTALAELAQGRLNLEAVELPEEYRKVADDFNLTLSSLNRTIGTVISGVETIDTGSAEIRHASDDLSRRTEQQAASLEETAASVSEAARRMSDASEAANMARRTIEETTELAGDGTATVRKAVEAMALLDESSRKINNIISVIDAIAFQTNLLALNAGVEAARAGETGKGFAVVASEVRALAQRCAQAADEVKALISVTSEHVQSGVDLVHRSGSAFGSISGKVNELAQTVLAIAETMDIQNESLTQINAVVSDLDRMTQQNAAMAEECTAAATSLARETQRLKATVAAFEIGTQANGTDPASATQRRQAMRLAAG